jgi:signal transduction histidine kinase
MQITGRSLRHHLLAYSALTLLLTLGLVTIVAWFPLTRRVTASAENALRHDSEMRARIVDESLQRLSELGWQISSRTAARITTTEYERGLISRQEAAALLTPRLRDAVEFSNEVRGLIRLDTHGKPLVQLGIGIPDSSQTLLVRTNLDGATPYPSQRRGPQGLTGTFLVNGSPHIALHTPVFSPDQRQVATDILIYDLGSLRKALSIPFSREHEVTCQLVARSQTDLPLERIILAATDPSASTAAAVFGKLPGQLDSESRLFPVDGQLVCSTPIRSCPWWLAVAAERSALLHESRSWLFNILGTVLGLGLVGLLGSLVLMRPLRDKILVAQEDLRRQVDEMERTRLRLETQSSLLLERNEDLRHFAYASAHDLKSPLITIGGHAQMLLDRLGPELDPERRKSLQYILAGSKRMFQHVNDMLDYSRAAEIEPRWTALSLERLCQDVISSLDGRIRESQAVVTLHELPVLQSDRSLLRMILQNLLDNALCYRQPDRVPEVRIEAICSADEAVIRVKDNGLGISPDDQPQVFGTFYRLHDDTKIPGSGLGLAICQRAVRRLNGAIELESEPGRGSCFTIRLPQPQVPVPPSDSAEPSV